MYGTQLAFGISTVRCFFHCGHTTEALDPEDAGDLMEQHYTARHNVDIGRAIGMVDVRDISVPDGWVPRSRTPAPAL